MPSLDRDPLLQRLRTADHAKAARRRRRRTTALAIGAVLIASAVALTGWLAHREVDRVTRASRRDTLSAIRDSAAHGLTIWMDAQERAAAAAARAPRIAPPARAALASTPEERADREAALAEALSFLVNGRTYRSWLLVDADGRVLAPSTDALLGSTPEELGPPVASALMGRARVGPPLLRADGDRLFVAAPVPGASDGAPGGALLFELDATRLEAVLDGTRIGRSGETYAFDREGRLLNSSRFEDDLVALGIRPEGTRHAVLRDPGRRLTRESPYDGGVAPLTRMVRDAVEGRSGVDVDGYRDYRGIEVMGAWTWLPEHGFGIGTEIDAKEALATARALDRVFNGLAAVLAVLVLGLFLALVAFERARRRAESLEIGPYRLIRRLGAGGMGVVYEAEHAMMKRPTALKLLDPQAADEGTMQRFEREVQHTAELTHPNTIAVYDYGRTRGGALYYAMELLEGADLWRAVLDTGPFEPARAIAVLRQACASLAEAHASGLVHRDIKPANIYLCLAGGAHDVVKVLDFGLVKADEPAEHSLTVEGAMVGTPAFMPPEMTRNSHDATAQSDVYAIGTVAYFLVTGRLVFDAPTASEQVAAHLRDAPAAPSVHLELPLEPELEQLILDCLAKDPMERPAGMKEVIARLDACPSSGGWSEFDAERWWRTTGAVFLREPQRARPAQRTTPL